MNDMEEYYQEVNLSRNSEKTSVLNSYGLRPIEAVPAKYFSKDRTSKWTADQLLAGSLLISFMDTFLDEAAQRNLNVVSYTSHCLMKMENKSGRYSASEILIRPVILLPDELALPKAHRCMEEAERKCFVKKVIQLNVNVHPQYDYVNRQVQLPM